MCSSLARDALDRGWNVTSQLTWELDMIIILFITLHVMTRVTRYTNLVVTVQLINIWTFTQDCSVITQILLHVGEEHVVGKYRVTLLAGYPD